MSISFTSSELLSEPISQEYVPQVGLSFFTLSRNRPIFSNRVIHDMIPDPRVIFGLMLLKGPINWRTRFFTEEEAETIDIPQLIGELDVKFPYIVKASNPEVEKFVKKTISRFWTTSTNAALRALEWGFSGSESLYEESDGKIQFDRLKSLNPPDTKAVTKDGEFVGLTLRNFSRASLINDPKTVFIGGPKAFWHVHWRERHPYYGLSRLFGAYIPWWEQWSDGGYRDIRRLWFYKNAFEGGIIWHPPGTTRDSNNMIIVNKDYAREIIEKKRTGGVMAFPNSPAETPNGRAWDYDPPTPLPVPAGLLEYGATLRAEILEGMGIPNEVIESPGNQGFGSSAGREVPELAFFAIIQELVQWLVSDVHSQIIKPLLMLNFSDSVDVEIIPFPMKTTQLEEQGNLGGSSGGTSSAKAPVSSPKPKSNS